MYCVEVERLEGGRASLVCQSPLAWLVCTWRLLPGPGSQHCALLTRDQVRPLDCQAGEVREEVEEEEEEGNLEDQGLEEVEVVGNRSWCGLDIRRVRRERHAGLWTCSLSSLQAGRLITTHSEDLSLEVLSRGELSLLVENNNNNQEYLVRPGLSLCN